jgi:hypothetical protein
MNPSRLLAKLALLPATLALAACETPTVLTKGGALDAFKPIQNSALAPCEMQKDVAEHNSRYDSIKNGKPVIYKAPCQVDKKPVPNEPKTS